ncbi:MAG: TerB family tellurite resistance protein, partial [Bacteroidia bacterium]|nr:TerB family tellurite resistance protein [Bacteroidia bacterium]
MKFGKWIGGGLGWVLGGPIGALLGFAIGSFLDGATQAKQLTVTTQGDFTVSLMVLIAAVMKADGKVLKSELDYVKNYLSRSFGSEVTRELLIILRKILEQEIPVEDVSHQIKANMDYASRLQLLHFLYGISRTDKEIHPLEIHIIEIIANNIGITREDQVSIRSMFIDETDSSYKIL